MSKTLSLALIILALIVGMGIGYVFTPNYAQMSAESRDSMDLGKADRNFDLRYINAMAAHHRGAMLLAEQVKGQTQRAEIKSLAESILQEEPGAINELYGWKQKWYKDSRKARDPWVPNLGTYDDKLDLRFLNALIAHHRSGIEMTQETRLKSTRNEVLNNADAVEKFLTDTGKILETWRSEWYSINK